jgi:methylmalonyl-CoA mutase C-terminal domain/subunit
MTIFSKVIDLMNEQGLKKVLVTGGGIIPKEDMDQLEKIGTGKLFGPGTPVKDSLDYIESWVLKNRR